MREFWITCSIALLASMGLACASFGSAILGDCDGAFIAGGCVGQVAVGDLTQPCYTSCDTQHPCPTAAESTFCEGVACGDTCIKHEDPRLQCLDCESPNGCGIRRVVKPGIPSICSEGMCTNGWVDPNNMYCPRQCKWTYPPL